MKVLALIEGWIIFALLCRLAVTVPSTVDFNIWDIGAAFLVCIMIVFSAYMVTKELDK